MAVCSTCNREMLAAPTCQPRPGAVPFGNESLWSTSWSPERADRCGDCGVTAGGTHHHRCSQEECGVCGGQRLSCPHGPHG
jgi:hypothetical protein